MATPVASPGRPIASASRRSTWPLRSRGPPISRARRIRFGRANPRTICGVSGPRPSRATISSRTTGVAVAVHASMRGGRTSASRSPICRYSGRKSWPHWLMQCASSTATSGISRSGEQSLEAGKRQALGGDVEQREVAGRRARHAAAHLGRLERGREIGGRDATLLERAHLVLHQRDERRDHHRGAGQQRRGQLVDQALAAAGRRHEQEPVGREQRLDGLALSRTEGLVAEPREPSLEVQRGGPRGIQRGQGCIDATGFDSGMESRL